MGLPDDLKKSIEGTIEQHSQELRTISLEVSISNKKEKGDDLHFLLDTRSPGTG
jgi:hypothetical protein